MASALHEAGAIGGIITLPSRRRVDEPDRDILFNCSPRGAADGALWRSTPLSDTWGCPWSAEATGRTSQTSAGTGGRTWPIISCQISLGVHMADHDPLRFATSLGAKLATRSRHVCVFLGAGAGAACGLPDMEGLQEQVLQQLTDQDRVAIKAQLAERTLEQVLTRLRRISALISGEEVVDGLTAARAQTLDAAVCHAIVTALNVNAVNPAPTRSFAAWAARANYRLPLELFTVNYDLLLESALERLHVPYFDGFVGTLEARFHTELVEDLPTASSNAMPAFFVRLWKLHGSVNWAWTDDRHIVRLGQPVPEARAAAIFPSDSKYEESRRVPFVVLQDRLRRALHQPETLMMITGYSFGDHHLNEHIFDAATRRQRSEFIAFCFSDIPQVLADRATLTPNLQVVSPHEAIIGGIRAEWQVVDDPPSYLVTG